MSSIDQPVFDVLRRIESHDLHAWQPGKSALGAMGKVDFSPVNRRIVADLLREGYFLPPSVTTESSMYTINGLRFSVATDDWGIPADAAQVRGIIGGGLAYIERRNHERLVSLHARTLMGNSDDALETVVLAALQMVTARYGDEFARYRHRVGVRARLQPV